MQKLQTEPTHPDYVALGICPGPLTYGSATPPTELRPSLGFFLKMEQYLGAIFLMSVVGY